MFKNKISFYGGALVVLIICIVIFSLIDDKKDNRKLNGGIFSVADTASVNRVVLTSSNFEHLLTRDNKDWRINSSHKVDQMVGEVMLSLMHNIRVKRPVAKAEASEIAQMLKEKGVEVEVFAGEDILKSYYVGGKPSENLTYFMDKETDEAYIVFLPGYNSYIASFFEMEESNWRDRTIFNSNWMGIKKFELKHGSAPKEGFNLVYEKNFFKIPNVANFDTTAIMEYLDMFQLIEADAYVISAEQNLYDSLVQHSPAVMEILLEDINASKSKEVSFYEHPSDSYFYIAKVKGKHEENLVLINRNKVKALSKKRSDFFRK